MIYVPTIRTGILRRSAKCGRDGWDDHGRPHDQPFAGRERQGAYGKYAAGHGEHAELVSVRSRRVTRISRRGDKTDPEQSADMETGVSRRSTVGRTVERLA
jgi:hypothetical protein